MATSLIQPPGVKRLSVICSAIAYVLLGLPIWWATTSLHRPPLPHDEIASVAIESGSRSALLPVALRVVLVVPADQQLPEPLSATRLLQSLQAAVPGPLISQARLLLSTTVIAAGKCTHAIALDPQQQHASCPDLSAAPVGGSSRQLDAWLQQQLAPTAAAAVQPTAGTVVSAVPTQPAAAAPGQYMLIVLPSNGSSSSNDTVTVGRNRHAWMLFNTNLILQQPQQVVTAAAAAAVRALSCCFTLHSTTAALTAAENLPISAAGQAQLSFTLLNADSSGDRDYLSWDFEFFERKYLAPITARLAPVCQTSVESQVLYFTPAREQGKWSKKHKAFVVKQSQLQFFIDSEWSVESGRAVMQFPRSRGGSSSSSELAAADADQSAVLEPHVLHFLVYIPARQYSPLLLLGPQGARRDSNSFWIPSWGGLMVLNKGNDTAEQQDGSSSSSGASSAGSGNQSADQEALSTSVDNHHSNSAGAAAVADINISSSGPGSSSSSTRCSGHFSGLPSQLAEHDYQQIAAVLIAQLQALFGVAPDMSSSSNTNTNPDSSSSSKQLASMQLQQLPAGAAGFTAWQIDALLRQRTGADVLEAARVLGSLSRLVLELPNLEMPDLIGQQVAQALADINLAWRHIAAGDYHAAGAAAAAARAAAEAAFLHPSVLAQLNFPDSHKLGVYMPLFLPISVPLLQGFVSQIQRYVKRRWEYRAVQLGQRLA